MDDLKNQMADAQSQSCGLLDTFSSFTLVTVLSHASQCYLVFCRSSALLHRDVWNHQDRPHATTVHMCTGRHTQTHPHTTPLPECLKTPLHTFH